MWSTTLFTCMLEAIGIKILLIDFFQCFVCFSLILGYSLFFSFLRILGLSCFIKSFMVAGQIEDDLIILHWTVGFLYDIKSYFEYFANKSKSFWKNRIFYIDKKYKILWIIKIDILIIILKWNNKNPKKKFLRQSIINFNFLFSFSNKSLVYYSRFRRVIKFLFWKCFPLHASYF